MTNIHFHLFYLFLLLLHLLLIPTAHSVALPAQQNAPASPREPQPTAAEDINADVTLEEIAVVHGNISAVFITRVIDRRARALNGLAASAMEMVDRQFGHQIVPKFGQLFSSIRSSTLAFVRQKTAAIMRWVREEDMPGKVDQAAPKTVEQRAEEKRQQMDTREFWVKMLAKCKLTDAQVAQMKVDLARDFKSTGRNMGYLEDMDEMIKTFKQMEMVVKMGEDVGRIIVKQQQNGNDEGNAPHPHANLFQKCRQLCVESVYFLKQIQLEIQLHWNFQKLQIKGITSDLQQYLKEYKKRRKEKRGMWCRGLLSGFCSSSTAKADAKRQREDTKKAEYEFYQATNELLDLNNAVADVHAKLRPPYYPNALPPDEDKYVTSLLEVAQLAKFTRTKKGVEIRNPEWVFMEKLVEIWDAAERAIIAKLTTIELKEIHKKLRTELAMPTEWLLRTNLEARNGDDKMEILTKRVHLALAQTMLVYERLNRFYKFERYHTMWKEGKFPPNKTYNHLKSCFECLKSGYWKCHNMAP